MRVCVIPARGGSVRIPRKNMRDFRGKPMLQWPIEAARKSGLFRGIIVSTDDDEIAMVARSLRCDVAWRDPDDGSTGTQDVVASALIKHGVACDEVVTIYPCSPLLDAPLLSDACMLFRRCIVDHLLTVDGGGRDAGCFYVQTQHALVEGWRVWQEPTIAYTLPPERCIDINTPEDWARAEQMFDALHST